MFVLSEVYGTSVSDVFSAMCLPNDISKTVVYLQKLCAAWREKKAISFEMTCVLLKRERYQLSKEALLFLPQILGEERKSVFVCWNNDIMRWFESERLYVPLVSGMDLCAAGMSPGAQMGVWLEACHRMQVEQGERDKNILIENLKRSL